MADRDDAATPSPQQAPYSAIHRARCAARAGAMAAGSANAILAHVGKLGDVEKRLKTGLEATVDVVAETREAEQLNALAERVLQYLRQERDLREQQHALRHVHSKLHQARSALLTRPSACVRMG